jgi:uncharacterized coiled-coil protein SlyX
MDEETKTAIKRYVADEVKRQTTDIIGDDELLAAVAQVSKRIEKVNLSLEETREMLRKNSDELRELNEMLKNMDLTSIDDVDIRVIHPAKSEPVAPKGKPTLKEKTPPAPEPKEEEPKQEEATESEWTKEQDGDLEKGETQIWNYGDHTLTIWEEGNKTFAQVDNDAAEELYRQKDLEKIQKRVEKME